ncbi:GAF domain-containing protein [Oculatella sp. LEGE 06141]|uniref:methyl-accepting chemotaxis protein n=1 Tax=Oculatella sp. LEGE 06141 TaxID=1828648 RepID=UPI001882F3E0|nr:methyl-accepting chemotaxis protein [Oculatella sp. LEGE 06141]MBE9179144.1 GAF domain-containing protein [Oculatella sp. LEGE 06141]
MADQTHTESSTGDRHSSETNNAASPQIDSVGSQSAIDFEQGTIAARSADLMSPSIKGHNQRLARFSPTLLVPLALLNVASHSAVAASGDRPATAIPNSRTLPEFKRSAIATGRAVSAPEVIEERLLSQTVAVNPDESATNLAPFTSQPADPAGDSFDPSLQEATSRPLLTGITQSQWLMILAAIITLLAIAATIAVLYGLRRLSVPLRYLLNAMEEVASGNLEVTITAWGTPETQALAKTLNRLVVTIRGLLQEQTIAVEQANVFFKLSIARALTQKDVEAVFNEVLAESCQLLQLDRMVIYRLTADRGGYVSNEAVVGNWPKALNSNIEDPCIPSDILAAYKEGRVMPTRDIATAGFHPAHLNRLQQLQVKANLVVPILHDENLFGLLVAHHCAKTHMWRETEISFVRQLANQLGVLLDRTAYLQAQKAQTDRSQILRDITLQVVQSNTSSAVLTQLPLEQVRRVLYADRVLVFAFDPQWQGTVVAESVDRRFSKTLGTELSDACFAKGYAERYKQGRIRAIGNIEQSGLPGCYIKQLQPFSVKAILVTPIIQHEQLCGLLIAHQCSQPRQWEQSDIDLMMQVANQIGLALDRCRLLEQKEAAVEQARILAEEQRQQKEALRDLLKQKEAAVEQARILAEEQRQQKEALRNLLKQKEAAVEQAGMLAREQRRQKEALQQQFMQLLNSVEGAAMGDLTVRAEVTDGEVGTVADFFNSIVESLRQIVTDVKVSAIQVSEAIGDNEDATEQLAAMALTQAKKITRVLDSVEQMTVSIQAVADNARQAAEVADTAFLTAETGGMAMDRTVDSILSLRATIGDTSKKMKRLSESSQRISRVISLIEKIALQTNLLAVNAGIEAARAGEDGQGFAVVAEEVGELAAKSAAATKEVEQIIATIQFETHQVVEAMEQSTAQAVVGTRQVEETKRSLHQILTVSQHINQLVKSISQATVSQTQTSREVAKLMQEVAQVSELTSDSSNKVSGSLRQTVRIAQELQASVGTFTVEQ